MGKIFLTFAGWPFEPNENFSAEYNENVTAIKKSLLEITPQISSLQKCMLINHCLAPERTISIWELANISGFTGRHSRLAEYQKVSELLCPALDKTELIGTGKLPYLAWENKHAVDQGGHRQWTMYEEIAQAIEELGWVEGKVVGDETTAVLSPTKPAFLLTWKEGNPPYKFEDFQEIETWRFRSHKRAKVGDEVYFLKQGKEPRGIFGRGVIIKSPYQIEDVWVVDVKIEELTDPSKSLFLTLEDLCQIHPPEGLWFSQSSGIRIPDDVADAMRSSKQWEINSIAPAANEYQVVPETSGTREVEIRIGQQQFRESLLQYWRGCSVTGCSFQEVLIASHIVPWSEASNSERLDVFNGLLLTPNLDKLFDSFLISFNSHGEILISKTISSKTMHDLGINPSMKLRRTDEKLLSYLQKHEKAFLEKEQVR